MSFFAFAKDPGLRLARREFITKSGVVLSGTAIALLAGREALATGGKLAPAVMKPGATEDDVKILNSALGSELEAIAAYQVGAESGLLQKPVLDLAVTFQSHHKAHAQVLASTIQKLGGKPVEAKAKYAFPVETLKTQADVLRFAGSLEKGAVSAYLGAVPLFADRELAKAAASILGDEAMHWAILRNAIGEQPVPGAFVG
jgi:rubrerythrin